MRTQWQTSKWSDAITVLNRLTANNVLMYIILLTYVRPIAEIEQHIAAHRDFLERHYAAGDLVFSGPRDPRTGGVILARFESDGEVKRFIEADPFYGANVAEYQTIRFHPTRFDPAFEPFTAPR